MAGEKEIKSLPVLFTRGSHYDIGYTIGRTFTDRIHQFYQNSTLVQQGLLPFYDCEAGRSVYASYLKNVTDAFPDYLKEIRGIADGCGMQFENIFLLNMAKEVYNFHYNKVFNVSKGKGGIWGCTVGYINTPDTKILAHNEDCDPTVKNYGYIVQAHIEDQNSIENGCVFTAYSYPGALCGGNYGFNNYGMAISCNGLYPNLAIEGATPRYFLNRALLRSKNFDDAISIAQNRGYGSAFGFCANMASLENPEKMCAMEVAPGMPESRIALKYIEEQKDTSKPCHYFHINNYRLMEMDQFEFMDSSIARTKKTVEFPDPKTWDDLKQVLGDTSNSDYPIYRTPRPTDDSQTVCTGVFDMLNKTMKVFVGNVKTETKPLIVMSMV